jgi:3-deoxy-D-manno-octulosonate 8-phosphate phosphatase (KDO 8-P phosphatase)
MGARVGKRFQPVFTYLYTPFPNENGGPRLAFPPMSSELPPLRPTLNFDPELLLRAQPVRVVFFDVDGVLTDGGLYFSEAGETLKRFHTLDGHGLKLLQRAGITPAVVTGRDSAALRKRLEALGVVHVRYGTEDKRPAAESILAELGLDWSAAAAMGDDWPDLPMLRRAALACVPPTAQAELLALAHVVTKRLPGAGAVRELCDLLLVASGAYARELEAAAQ